MDDIFYKGSEMTYQLSEKEKAEIKQDVLNDFKTNKIARWSNVGKIYQKRIADREHEAKKNALRKEGKLRFQDLIRFA